MGLEISDRIHLRYEAAGDVANAITDFEAYIRQETLALEMLAGTPEAEAFQQTVSVGGQKVVLAVRKGA